MKAVICEIGALRRGMTIRWRKRGSRDSTRPMPEDGVAGGRVEYGRRNMRMGCLRRNKWRYIGRVVVVDVFEAFGGKARCFHMSCPARAENLRQSQASNSAVSFDCIVQSPFSFSITTPPTVSRLGSVRHWSHNGVLATYCSSSRRLVYQPRCRPG